ncbi:MAG TPA: hypothetical protein VGT99_06880 [Gammaproteobacteria bacterium]|nr:hypothetical protein [Gammaproteobacteria bacterium]
MAQARDCPRCEGSGRVYVTNRESTTGRRRVYKGPAPIPGVIAARQQQELNEALQKQRRPHKRPASAARFKESPMTDKQKRAMNELMQSWEHKGPMDKAGKKPRTKHGRHHPA